MKSLSIVQGFQESIDGIKATSKIHTVISVVAVVVQGDAIAIAFLQVIGHIVSETQPICTQSELHWIAATKTVIGMVLERDNNTIFIFVEGPRR